MKEKRLLWLFFTNVFISSFTFGGGYVVIPMVKKYFVERKAIFDEEELMRIAAVAQSSPGAIAVNMAALAGYRTAGNKGLIISCIAAILPPLCILAIVSVCYDFFMSYAFIQAALKGMEAGVAAIIVDVVYDMYRFLAKDSSTDYKVLPICVFALHYFLHVNILWLLLSTILYCVVKVIVKERRMV